MQPRPRRPRPAVIATQLLMLAVLTGAALNYQWLLDRYALATYTPGAATRELASGLGLTDYGRALLYRADPTIDAKAAFNANCETTKGELELGCYYKGRIHVLSIDNDSLAPEMRVVLAHEVLHAAWARLSERERRTLGSQLTAYYEASGDASLRERMAQYAVTEPGEEANELHSILPTEYAELPPALQQYYQRYFTDRTVITAAHAKYEAVFDSRRQELEAQLATIRQLKSQLATVNTRLDANRSAGNIAAYNALVPTQNGLVDDINRRIDTYQTGVDEYNALSRSLDSQEITDTEAGVSR